MSKVYKIIANNIDEAKRMALGLVEASQWFELTPLPFDEYEFVVKDENWKLVVGLKTAQPDVERNRAEEFLKYNYHRRLELILIQANFGLTEEQDAELASLQSKTFEALGVLYPKMHIGAIANQGP